MVAPIGDRCGDHVTLLLSMNFNGFLVGININNESFPIDTVVAIHKVLTVFRLKLIDNNVI